MASSRSTQSTTERISEKLAPLCMLAAARCMRVFFATTTSPAAKISAAEVNQKLEAYKKIYGQGGKMDFSSPEGKKTLDEMRKQIVQILIQERILLTEAVKEGVTVSPQEIADRIASIKKGLNLSDKEFEDFLKNHAMSMANFEKRIERELLINKLIEKGTQEKGLKKEAWINALIERAKVEVF